jgi:hypothetical protein
MGFEREKKEVGEFVGKKGIGQGCFELIVCG